MKNGEDKSLKYVKKSIQIQENKTKNPSTKYETSEFRLSTFEDEEDRSFVSGLQHTITGKPKKKRGQSRSRSRNNSKRASSELSDAASEERKSDPGTDAEQKWKPPMKPNKHSSEEYVEEFKQTRLKYINKHMEGVQTHFCNFGEKYDTIKNIRDLMRFDFHNKELGLTELTPIKIRVDCTIYHGCDELLEKSNSKKQSKSVYFSPNVTFDQVISFENLKYCQIPVKTRLAFDIILIFQENATLTIGTVSINLFDENSQFRSGVQDLNIWPFYEKDERLGCMKEYNGVKSDVSKRKNLSADSIHLEFSKLVVGFDTFICPLVYSSRDEKKITKYKLTKTKEDIEDEKMLVEKSINN